ncbi:rhodanese-like domain-containing protein [Treponema sp. HNW]|uniref:rhodanese-like domain-containing protein n=1 Tax=Treponema sp. HNW TaxID=3116654 RepID=UPI003D105818
MKRLLILIAAVSVLAACSVKKPAETVQIPAEPVQKMLPAPVDTSKPDAQKTPYAAGVSSINASNLFEYFGRDDVLYIDVRDFGDYQKKHLRNFECIPYFAFIFNADAGKDAKKTQLYGGTVSEPVSVYKESDDMLNVLFPKDKTLFIMCQGGGRVAQLMTILEKKGYDMSKIYNVGGMGQFTASEYADYTVDALEFKVNAAYSIEGLTKN